MMQSNSKAEDLRKNCDLMEEDYYKILDETGKISEKALILAKEITKPGEKVVDIADKLESYIIKEGYKSTFPINISINSIAAHYTPTFGDELRIKENDVVKVDLGARKEDVITDSAVTLCFSDDYAKMVDVCSIALDTALSQVKSGRMLKDIGKEVDEIVKKEGFKVVKNLGGHGLAKGELHADIFIPNFDNGDETELKEGQTIAVEVFITDGAGKVNEGDFVQIFQKYGNAMPRSADFRQIAEFIDNNYGTYPFAMRWLVNEFRSEFKVKATLNELMRMNALESFPVLVEAKNGIVAQKEVTAVVELDSCKIIVKH
jgi:methionyl aminopeptidase